MIINNAYITDEQLQYMEQFIRLDCKTTKSGKEVYASFTMDDDGNLVKLSRWEPIEQAMESYIAFFIDDTPVKVNPKAESLIARIRKIFKW